MYPDCEFLPRAPDPEEIILEDEDSAPGPAFEGDTKAEGDDDKTELGSGDAQAVTNSEEKFEEQEVAE